MLFRINLRNFLVHMIDYFTAEELAAMDYIIISTPITNGSIVDNVVWMKSLLPDNDWIMDYANDLDMDTLVSKYVEAKLKDPETKRDIFNSFVKPVVRDHSVRVIVCSEHEDDYIDIFTTFIKKEFGINCIDLNELFLTGKTDIYMIDKDLVDKMSYDITKSIKNAKLENKLSTEYGLKRIVTKKMTEEQKLKKLKSLGVKLRDKDRDNLDSILIEAWRDELEEYNRARARYDE